MAIENQAQTPTKPKLSQKFNSKTPTYKHRDYILKIAQLPGPSAYETLNASVNGMNSDEIEETRKFTGLNEIAQDRVRWQTQLRKALINPFNILLGVLAGVSFATDDLKGTITLAAMVIISVSLTFIQEFRSSKAAENLKKMVQTRATVLRRIRPDEEESEAM